MVPADRAEPEEVQGLLAEPELEAILEGLRRRFDYILLDTPALGVVSGASLLGRAAAEAVLVVRMHKTRRDVVQGAIRLLHAANVKPVGMVLTHCQ